MPVINKSKYAPLALPRKDPSEKMAYALDWSDWLMPDETISNLSVNVTGATLLGSNIEGVETRFSIGGGTAGTVATILVHIVSDSGLEGERTATLEITER